MSVNSFDVFKVMSERNSPGIKLAPLDNVSNLRKVKGGTLVTIGVAGDEVAAIGIHRRYIGGLILADREQANKVRAELEQGADPSKCEACAGGWAEANAENDRHIARIVELESALREIEDHAANSWQTYDARCRYVVEVARAAITKAEGREP